MWGYTFSAQFRKDVRGISRRRSYKARRVFQRKSHRDHWKKRLRCTNDLFQPLSRGTKKGLLKEEVGHRYIRSAQARKTVAAGIYSQPRRPFRLCGPYSPQRFRPATSGTAAATLYKIKHCIPPVLSYRRQNPFILYHRSRASSTVFEYARN